jgi:hypothetical protein
MAQAPPFAGVGRLGDQVVDERKRVGGPAHADRLADAPRGQAFAQLGGSGSAPARRGGMSVSRGGGGLGCHGTGVLACAKKNKAISK